MLKYIPGRIVLITDISDQRMRLHVSERLLGNKRDSQSSNKKAQREKKNITSYMSKRALISRKYKEKYKALKKQSKTGLSICT